MIYASSSIAIPSFSLHFAFSRFYFIRIKLNFSLLCGFDISYEIAPHRQGLPFIPTLLSSQPNLYYVDSSKKFSAVPIQVNIDYSPQTNALYFKLPTSCLQFSYDTQVVKTRPFVHSYLRNSQRAMITFNIVIL